MSCQRCRGCWKLELEMVICYLYDRDGNRLVSTNEIHNVANSGLSSPLINIEPKPVPSTYFLLVLPNLNLSLTAMPPPP